LQAFAEARLNIFSSIFEDVVNTGLALLVQPSEEEGKNASEEGFFSILHRIKEGYEESMGII
jgi:hypothetical protein